MMSVNDSLAIKLLINGSVGVVPTDTVYGLVASANSQTAVSRLYLLKKRGDKPGTIIASNVEQLISMGLNPSELRMAKYIWPGPVSLVVNAETNLKYLHQGKNSLAVRVVDDYRLSKILDITGPLISSSANAPGQPVAENIQSARKYFKDSVDFYVDGGDLSTRKSSTIIKINAGKIEALRIGVITSKQLDILQTQIEDNLKI